MCLNAVKCLCVHRKADQWDARGPVCTWKPRSVPVSPNRRWRQRDGLQERQHQQPEQRYFHAGRKGRREDSLLSPLYGHTAEATAEVGREGPRAGCSETLRGWYLKLSHSENEKDHYRFQNVSLPLFPLVVQSILCFLFQAVLSLHFGILPVIQCFVFWGFLLFTCSKLVFLSEAEDVHGEGG